MSDYEILIAFLQLALSLDITLEHGNKDHAKESISMGNKGHARESIRSLLSMGTKVMQEKA